MLIEAIDVEEFRPLLSEKTGQNCTSQPRLRQHWANRRLHSGHGGEVEKVSTSGTRMTELSEGSLLKSFVSTESMDPQTVRNTP